MTGVWRATLLAGVFVAVQVGAADAQFWQPFRSYDYRPSQNRQEYQSREDSRTRQDSRSRDESRPRKTNRTTTAAKKKKDTPIRQPFGENMPKGPLQLMVSIGDQRAVLYSNGVRVADAKVSTGVAKHPTPTGVFSIIQKNRWHRSNIYSNAPMYYMHRLTWSGIALHEGHLPGYAASHGCIRMPTEFVSRLWNVSKLGMRVVVARVELKPQEISHAKLFNPAPKPADSNRTSETPAGLRPSLNTTGQGFVRIAQAEPSATETETTSEPATSAPATSDTAAAADVATSPAAPAAAEPVTTSIVTVPAAEQPPAESARSAEPAPAAPAARPAAEIPALAAPAAIVADPERPRRAIDPNELTVPRPAPLPRSRTGEPAKLNGQVAVFISGKEKRIFVRHAFVPVFDMPIEIANPGKPLGTHTFTALELVDGGKRMRWNAISMPLTAAQPVARASKKGAPPPPQRVAKNVRGAVVTSESSNATDALDRVEIPQEAIERIAELLTPGSSLIISDEGLGRETGRYTEFIVETR